MYGWDRALPLAMNGPRAVVLSGVVGRSLESRWCGGLIWPSRYFWMSENIWSLQVSLIPPARERENVRVCARRWSRERVSLRATSEGRLREGRLDGTFHPARVDVLTQELPLVVALFGLLPIQLAEHFAQRQVMPDAVLPPRLGRLEEAGKTKQKTNQKNKNTIGLVGWLGRWGWLVGERRHRRPLKPPPSRKTRGEGDLGSVAKKGLAG